MALTSALETPPEQRSRNQETTRYNHKSQPEMGYPMAFLLPIQKAEAKGDKSSEVEMFRIRQKLRNGLGYLR